MSQKVAVVADVPTLAWQATLLGEGPDDEDLSFARLARHHLDERSWVDHVPRWLLHPDQLFEELLTAGRWQQRDRHMYDNVVTEPRLVSSYTTDDLPTRLQHVRATLSTRYRVEFDSTFINLYRDGQDSVAWHGDSNRKTMRNPLVAIVSIGDRRRLLLRPASGQRRVSRAFELGGGDLLVMGGACQHEWQHTVPKVRSAGARMSVTFRHSRDIR